MDWVAFVTALAGAVTALGNIYYFHESNKVTQDMIDAVSDQIDTTSTLADGITERFKKSQEQMDTLIAEIVKRLP